jgi:putative (di)nucleoside polyphosphate hydrolase
MSKDASSLPYRPCVGVALFNQRGEVFVGRRKDAQDNADRKFAWQMPQGGIDKGEEPYAAALRELYEETGIRSVKLLGEAPEWLSYDLPPDLLSGTWKGRYRGQTQKWYAFRFIGEESEINIAHPADGHEVEFVEWRWIRLPDAAKSIVAFKRPVYERLAEVFAPFSGAVAHVTKTS